MSEKKLPFDFHTHRLNVLPGTAIVSLPLQALLQPKSFELHPNGLYAAGIHPYWLKEHCPKLLFNNLKLLLQRPEVIMLGECGWDALTPYPLGSPSLSPSWVTQSDIFMQQALLANHTDFPLTIHCVRSYHLLLRAHSLFSHHTQWIVHGFRGKPTLAQQLLKANIHLSFGKYRNKESFLLTPPNMRYEETDEE